MENKLESLVKHKKVGKSVVVGKVVGGIAGIIAGISIGKEIPEFLNLNYSDYLLFGMKLSPALLFYYLGQRIGGYVGVAYYFNRMRGNKKK